MEKVMRYIKSLCALMKLETMTTAGRINLFFTIILTVFVIAYTTNDMLCYLISAVRDTIKTIALKKDVSNAYQTVSVFKMAIPIIVLMVLCFFYLYWDDKRKRELDKNKDN